MILAGGTVVGANRYWARGLECFWEVGGASGLRKGREGAASNEHPVGTEEVVPGPKEKIVVRRTD